MKRKTILKIVVDIGMTVMLLFLMTYELIGAAAHEWLGMGMFVLFITHHILNRKWSQCVFKGRYTLFRIWQTTLVIGILLTMLGSMYSGVILSEHALSFLPIKGGRAFAREVHMISSYWGFVLMSLHIGLHWRMAVGMTGNLCGRKKIGRTSILLLRIAFRLIALYGVYAFVRRQIGSYMFLQNQFVFFDFGEPRIFFFMDYLAVMCLFAVCGYYAVGGVALLEKRRKRA